MYPETASTGYKEALVEFVNGQEFDWAITIGIGSCPDDDETMRRLRAIDAILSKKYLLNRYHKLPQDQRFLMIVAFEGQRADGVRHAHILLRVPTPLKKGTRSMLIGTFPTQFRFLWDGVSLRPPPRSTALIPNGEKQPIHFERVNTARKIYTIKKSQSIEQPWSRLEIIPPPQWHKFENETLSAIRNRDRQKRALLGLNCPAV